MSPAWAPSPDRQKFRRRAHDDGPAPTRTRRPAGKWRRLSSGNSSHYHVNLARAVDAPDQDLLDIGRAAGARDQHHGTRLRGGIGQDREQLIESGEHTLLRDYRDMQRR